VKRTPLARKTPLKAKSPMARKAKRKPSAKQREARWRSDEYLAWVRTRPCVVCGSIGGVAAHHLKGVLNASGGGLKAPDSLSMPACDPFFGGWNNCHARIHSEKSLRDKQPAWLIDTLTAGLEVFQGETREELVRSVSFVREGV